MKMLLGLNDGFREALSALGDYNMSSDLPTATLSGGIWDVICKDKIVTTHMEGWQEHTEESYFFIMLLIQNLQFHTGVIK